jgi:predicted PhzF superfamily epimerase YddE/YHI9
VLFVEENSVTELLFSAQAVGEIRAHHTEYGSVEMAFPNRKPEPITQIPRELTDGLSIAPQEVLQVSQAYFVIYSSEYDFISRYFWPANGGAEDPVTGSIHAGLASLWAERLGKKSLVAYWASTGGGLVGCKVMGDKVIVSGKAVQYLEGFIEV